MRRTQATVLVLLFGSVGLTQCGSNQREPMEANRNYGASDFMAPASRVEEPRSEARGTEQPRTGLSNGKIAMATDVAHNAAIESARIAFVKTKNERVREFAQTMLADHGRAKQEETKLLLDLRVAPEASDISTDLGVDSGQALLAMRDASASSVDRTYIESQIAAHEKFAKILDEQLIPNARSPELQDLLRRFREREKAHLDEAREIERELPAEGEPGGAQPAVPSLP